MRLNEATRSLGETPYWVFVSFLYAFIAADIAQRFSKLSSHWSELEEKSEYAWGGLHFLVRTRVLAPHFTQLRGGNQLARMESIRAGSS